MPYCWSGCLVSTGLESCIRQTFTIVLSVRTKYVVCVTVELGNGKVGHLEFAQEKELPLM